MPFIMERAALWYCKKSETGTVGTFKIQTSLKINDSNVIEAIMQKLLFIFLIIFMSPIFLLTISYYLIVISGKI